MTRNDRWPNVSIKESYSGDPEAGNLKDAEMDRFIDSHPEVVFSTINIDGKVIALLDSTGLPIDLENLSVLRQVVDHQQKVVEAGIRDNCYQVAKDLARQGLGGPLDLNIDILNSQGTWSFFQYSPEERQFLNHALNAIHIPGEAPTVLVVDFTAPLNHDEYRGAFNVFCIRAHSLDEARKYLRDFHGGDWYRYDPKTKRSLLHEKLDS